MTLSLLLVEDKPATRVALLKILAASAFTVTCANDGLDGLKRAKSQSFDAFIIDHKMPLMDGINLIKNIRALAGYQQTPIIFMTTQDIKQVQPLACAAGADLCLAKPLVAEQMIDILEDLAYANGAAQNQASRQTNSSQAF